MIISSLLFADSDFNPRSLTFGSSPAPSLLFKAASMGDDSALQALSLYASNYQSQYWLEMAASLSSETALFELAQLSVSEVDRQKYYRLAAQQGNRDAQFELAMLAGQQREFWLEKAANQGLLKAQVALYQWYLLQHHDEQALYWLEIAAKNDGESALLLAQRLWAKADYERAKVWMHLAKDKKIKAANEYVRLMDAFWPTNQFQTQLMNTETECTVRIQPIATSLLSMKKIQQHVTDYNNDSRLSELPMCFNRPIWVDDQLLACSGNWRGQQRLGCNLTSLDEKLNPSKFTHLLVVADRGKANVNQGVIYLDLADNYDVLVHELAHLVGFVDEYPLSDAVAEQVCYQGVDAPNLIIKDVGGQQNDYTDVESMDLSYWQQFDLPIRLSAARTCNNHLLQAYKPASKLTFMEYYDTAYIPPIYLVMWQSRLVNKEGVVPAYQYLARQLEDANLDNKAQRWWQALRIFNQQVVTF